VTDIYHFGVKGMRWGVRRERRIEKRMRDGRVTRKSAETADTTMRRERRNRNLVLAGATLVVAGPELMRHSINVLNTVAGHRREEAGRKAAQAMFSDSHGVPSYSTINLQFNPGNNTWE
jgi:hypothetical protein